MVSRKNKIIATIFAFLAAALYAINMPLSKLLLDKIGPTMQAAFLYLGAGIGIGILFLFHHKKITPEEKIVRSDIPYVIGMIVLDIAAPILLMFGLKTSASSSATLLNNFEIVATSLIALILFKEVISKKMWLAITLVTLSSFLLCFEDLSTFQFSYGSLYVLGATICWGFENNCTRKLADKNTYEVVFLKGIFSGLGSLIVALIIGEKFSDPLTILYSLLLGFVAFGLSIFFYIKAQKYLGAAKTSAYYSIAPFIGTLLSLLILKESINWNYYVGLAVMILGTIVIILDTLEVRHCHEHTHVIKVMEDGKEVEKTIVHTHEHIHLVNLNNHPYIFHGSVKKETHLEE